MALAPIFVMRAAIIPPTTAHTWSLGCDTTTIVSGVVRSAYGVPAGMFGAGAERVWVTTCSGGAALGKEAEDLGTKRTVEARAMVLAGASVGKDEDGFGLGMGPGWLVF